MGIDTTQLGTDLGNMINDLPGVVQYAGITFPAVVGTLTYSDALEVGGPVSSYGVELHAKTSASLPSVVGVTVATGGRAYRVMQIQTVEDGQETILVCGSVDK